LSFRSEAFVIPQRLFVIPQRSAGICIPAAANADLSASLRDDKKARCGQWNFTHRF
jgi:hypothetical protein